MQRRIRLSASGLVKAAVVLFLSSVVPASAMVAECLDCPKAQLTLEDKAQWSFHDAHYVVIGQFELLKKTRRTADDITYRDRIFMLHVVNQLKGERLDHAFEVQIGSYVADGAIDKDKKEECGKIRAKDFKDLELRGESTFEQETREQLFDKTRKLSLCAKKNGIDALHGVFIVPVRLKQSSDFQYRVTDVPLIPGKKYIVFLMGLPPFTSPDKNTSFSISIDLYPLSGSRGERVLKEIQAAEIKIKSK